VYARRLKSAGAALTGEVQVAQTTADNQQWARVASDDAGNFVVTWTSTNQDGTPQSVYARRFAADGTALTSEFRVHTTASGSQVDSAIAMDAVGNFVIAWEGNGPGDTTGVFARRFDSTGTPIDVTEFAVNTDTTGTQSNAAVAMNLAGEFVVIWDDANGVHGRHFDNAGTPQGPQFNIDSGNSAGDGAIAMDNAGGFVVVWRETTLDIGIHARRFDSLDTPLGISTIVNTTTFGDQTNPSITMDDAGDYIIVWEGVGTGDSDGVFARKYDSSGTALTGEFRVNDTTTNTQSQTSVAMLDVDNFVVVWSGEGAGDVDGVFARQFHHVPPVLDLDANNSSGSTGADFSANFTDGGGAVAIVDSDATLTDGNDTDLQSLTVTITDRQDGSNELLSANTAGTSIVASFNSFFGVLTLSSMDTVEHYEQVLRTVTYDNGINPATGPSRTITFVANDGVTNSNLGTTSLSINATPNQSPTADAGGPYVINEGGVLNLDGSASSDPDTDPLTFAWDLDNDGNFGEAGEPVTETPTVTWATLQSFGIDDDSGGPYTISLRVADGKGGFDTATTMLTVNNVAPTLSTTGTGAATVGSSYTLNLAASDPGADTISSWTINWGDGTIETIAGNPSTANHTYTATGFTFNILASATDEDGTYLQNELLVASSKNDRVLRYGSDAGFLQAFATSDGSDYPVDTIIGPDGNLYLSGWNSNDVLRYNATTGVFIDAFVSAGSGGLTSAAGLGFGLDGDLYVASRLTSEVLRFDGSTGAFIDAFVTAGSGGLDEAEGLTFGPNGDLYVSDYANNAVYKYDGNTGVFDAVFVTSGSGGLDKAEVLVFGPDGNLYVADDNGSSVLRYNGTTGAFIDDFIPSGSNGLTFATGVDFGPDGNLYIGSWGTDNVLRFDGTTGAFIDEYISAGSGGLDEPGYFTFIPEHQVTVSDPPNNAPTADAGGPYAINEGDSVNLIGSASSDPDLDTLTYAWDLDNDGNFGEVGEPTTETPTVSWTTLVSLGIDDDPGSPFTIGLQVDDGNGGVDTTTTTLTVSNVNPTGNADGGAGFTTNEDTAFTTGSVLTNDTDPNLLDVLSVASLDVIGTTGLVVNNADGTFSYDPNGQFESLASGQQTTDTFSYAVSDDDGGSSSATVTITIDGANDAPTDISLDSLTVSESVAGAVVGNLSTTDIDTGDTHTYVVDDTRFEVVGGQLKLKAAAILDFETEMAVNVTITSTDALGLPVNEAFVLTVTDVNDIAPVIDPAQSFNIAEDIANLAVVGVVTATDDDTTGEPRQNWMIIGGDPAGVFAINGATGQITIADNTTLDFDTAPTSYALSVTTSDGTNTSAAETVTINLTDVNDFAPVIDPAQSFNIAENIANLAIIGTVTASDADTTGEPRQNWMIIGGDPAEAFAINGATGQITIADNSTLDFDFAPTSYVLTLTTSDGTNTSAAETVTINLTDVNDEVPVVPSGQSFNLAENVANTTVVGTVIATDADTGDSLNWSITGGNPGGTFAVNSATGQITVASNLNLDFETTPTFNVTLRVEDAVGAFDTAIVTVSLLNQNEAPTADDAVFAVGEDAAPGLSIGVVAASDPDAGDTRSWSILSGNTNGAFSLNSLTGELTVASPSTLDFETTPTYTLNVQAQDVGGLTDSATVVVNVSNVDEAPTTTGLADVFVNEDSADVAIDLKTAFSDVETPSAALSYSIVGNSNPTLFSETPIVGGNLTLKFAADANGNAFVTVRATDPQGLFVTTAFNVVVTPVADAPTSTADSYVVVGDQLTVPPAGGVLANDSDPDGDAISALLVSGPANGSLVLLSNGGFTYTPNDDFRGIDTFVYEPFDGAATGPQRTVVLNVTRAIAPPPPPTDSGSSDSGESDDAASAAESDGSESAEATIDAPPSAVDGSVQSSVVVESADGATSQASESADDDANEELAGPYTASESGEDFLSGPAQRLELRDAASVIVKTLNDVNSDGDSTDSDNRFRDSLRFDGEDLSYLVSTEFIQELEQVEDEFEFHGAVPEWATGTAVATTASISVGYIMWMLRGGYVLASVLSTMPVWQNIDPLPVLAALDAADDEDDDSLETMIDRASDEADDSEGLSSDEAASDAERKDQIV
ncbi:MAG: VCBS repeat-containing protein, partial [Porticoccaceae bacterium]